MPGDLGIRHEGGAPGNVVHPLQQRLGLADSFRPNHVDQPGVGLHHVGRHPAGIHNGIVNGALGLHMLPEKLNAYVHQLGGVQGGTTVVGIPGGVGSGALEAVDHLEAGGVGACGHLIGVTGVPGEGGV